MKIARFEEIRDFGIFSDSICDSKVNNFKKYNFIYGWNYSGKTTLSRLFRCLENKRIHPDFPNVRFKLKTDSDPITERNIEEEYEEEYNVRVFNEDFIEENFKWHSEEHQIESILILGKESNELHIHPMKDLEGN
ncbi:MAG TPA: AAA family ATPase [Fervidobacterium sp.]|nr:AAA family ATPase [Fervidobacterium sp.]